jgi:hypothetical protein
MGKLLIAGFVGAAFGFVLGAPIFSTLGLHIGRSLNPSEDKTIERLVESAGSSDSEPSGL